MDDNDFLINSLTSGGDFYKGEDLINDIAEYWNSKLNMNQRGEYEINGVVHGENFLREVNNDIFTNYLAKISIESCKYALRLQDK